MLGVSQQASQPVLSSPSGLSAVASLIHLLLCQKKQKKGKRRKKKWERKRDEKIYTKGGRRRN